MFGVAFWINRIFLCNLGSAHWHLGCKMAEKTRENIFLSSGSQTGYPEKSHHACITGLVNFFGKWEVEIIPLKLSVYPRGLIMKLSPIVQDDHGGRAPGLIYSIKYMLKIMHFTVHCSSGLSAPIPSSPKVKIVLSRAPFGSGFVGIKCFFVVTFVSVACKL